MKSVTQTPPYIIDQARGIDQSNWDKPECLAISQLSMHKLFKTVAIEPLAPTFELPVANNILGIDTLVFPDPLIQGRKISGEQLLNRRIYNDALLVMQHGQVVHESYRNGMTGEDRHVIHSCTKSLCSMLIGISIDRGLINTGAAISDYVPQFQTRAEWEGVTVQHVLDMQAGIAYSEDYSDPKADYWSYARAAGYYPPLPGEPVVGARAWAIENLNSRSHAPGTAFAYNSCLSNVLGMALENIYQTGLGELFEKLLYQRIGAESPAYFNTDHLGFPITEGQFNVRLRDFARCALLMINGGKNLADEQILPPTFIDSIVTPDSAAQKAYHQAITDPTFPKGQYKNQFWVVEPEKKRFTMLGIHGQFAWYDLEQKLMMVGVGSYPCQDSPLMMQSLNTLWTGVADSLTGA